MTTEADTPQQTDGRSTWSPARRAAQEQRNGARPERLTIPIVTPRGVIGSIELPIDMSDRDWEVTLQLINGYRYAMQMPTS